MPIPQTCIICGNSFSYFPSRPRQYCSSACYYQSRKTDWVERFWSKVEKGAPNECWDWKGTKDKGGYGLFRMREPRYNARATRLVYKLYYGVEIPNDKLACHSCDNPLCVNPAHLFVGTIADNNKDMYEKGRGYTRPKRIGPKYVRKGYRHGENSPVSKLTTKQVQEIRTLYRDGASLGELAAIFNCNKSYIHSLVNFKYRKTG